MRYAILLFLLFAPMAHAQELVLVNTVGKELPLKNWKFTQGFRTLPGQKDSFFELREEKSTGFLDGILTLIPTSVIRKIDYDYEKKTVAVTAAAADGKDVVLAGSTNFKQPINRVGLSSTPPGLDKTFTFVGGDLKDSKAFATLKFSDAKPLPESKGAEVKIIDTDKTKTTHTGFELQALGKSGFIAKLPFRKTAQIELDQIAKLRHVEAENPKAVSNDFEVTLKDGNRYVLTLIKDDIVGILARTPVGYKLFPPHTISEVTR